MNDTELVPEQVDQPTRRAAHDLGRCVGCGTVRTKGTACTTADCPAFVPINQRTAADHEVHR